MHAASVKLAYIRTARRLQSRRIFHALTGNNGFWQTSPYLRAWPPRSRQTTNMTSAGGRPPRLRRPVTFARRCRPRRRPGAAARRWKTTGSPTWSVYRRAATRVTQNYGVPGNWSSSSGRPAVRQRKCSCPDLYSFSVWRRIYGRAVLASSTDSWARWRAPSINATKWRSSRRRGRRRAAYVERCAF